MTWESRAPVATPSGKWPQPRPGALPVRPALSRPPANWLLRSLAPRDLQRLALHLHPVTFKRGQVLYESHARAQRVYFPDAGLISLVLTANDGAEVEVSVVGPEGLVGAAGLLGSDRTLSRAVVHISGHGWSMPVPAVLEELRQGGALQPLLLRYLQALLVQSFQTTLCNRRHSVEARLSRWLLTTYDRVQSPRLPVTQSLIAHMLGTRRPGVTEACGALAKAGLVECGRGYIKILDYDGLRHHSCECHKVIHDEFARILGHKGQGRDGVVSSMR